jgi:hypothetical protein
VVGDRVRSAVDVGVHDALDRRVHDDALDGRVRSLVGVGVDDALDRRVRRAAGSAGAGRTCETTASRSGSPVLRAHVWLPLLAREAGEAE